MKINIITQTFPPKVGGMQILMSSLADGLSALNFDVNVYPDHFIFKKDSNYIIYNTISPKLIRPYIKRIKLMFNSHNDEIFICDSWKSVSAIPKGRKIIFCFALAQELLVRKEKEQKIQKAFNRCKYIIPISNFTSSLIKSKWLIEDKKIKVINPTFSIKPKILSNKKRNIPLLIFSLCRIEKRKGLMQVANSLIRLKNKLPEFKWHIAGTGDAKDHLYEIVNNSNIKDNVFFEGKISEKNKDLIFKSADLFVMPSYQEKNSLEGYGISYTEASSYGLPSIAGIEGGVTDAVIDNFTGWSVDPNNESEIDKVILDSFNNNRKRLQFGINALNVFHENHTSQKAFKKLTDLF